jgi:hypothetical protein
MSQDKLYSFAFRGLLTGVALDKVGHTNKERFSERWEVETAKRLGIPLLDEELTAKARKMAIVYTAICAFENSVRKFIEDKFSDEEIEDWWENNVNANIRSKAEGRKNSEKSVRWLTPRGSSMIYYTEFGDLISIMCSEVNWDYFEVHVQDKEWAKGIITTLEKSRNIIMHGGELAQVDIERVGMFIRDWISQVG